ncbi:hypothetical protein CR513_09128, partial [Mucuna pruriens]
MTVKTKIDVHARMLSMEFGDTLVQFNIFEAMKHTTKDHSLFGIDLIDELVEECLLLDSSSKDIPDFAKDIDPFDCLGSITEKADYDEVWEVHNLSDPKDDNIDPTDLNQVCKCENPECSNKAEVQVAETKKPFTVKYESTKGGRDRERTEVNSAKKTSVKADLHVYMQAETILAKEDQKQARAESISDNQCKNRAPSRFDFSAKQRAKSDPNLTRAILSWPKGVGHNSQRPKSCRHTWCRVQFKSASRI